MRNLDTIPSADSVDAIDLQKVNTMSIKPMGTIVQDPQSAARETPREPSEYINGAMEEIRQAIEKLDPATKVACDQAMKQDPQLLRDPRFVLRFLRAAMHDTDDCVKRLVSYFEQKKHLFGTKRLCRPVTIGDLNEDDRKCLRSGIMQILPARDCAGRGILFWNVCLRGSHSSLSQQRVQFYGLQVGSEPVEVQHRGMIIIFWNHGSRKMSVSDMEAAFRNPITPIAMHQIRCEAFHCCLDPEDDQIIPSALTELAKCYSKIIFRAHSGTVADIQAALKTYGVPVHLLPQGEDASTSHHNRMKRCHEGIENISVPQYLLNHHPFLVVPFKTMIHEDKATSKRHNHVIKPVKKKLKKDHQNHPSTAIQKQNQSTEMNRVDKLNLSSVNKESPDDQYIPTDKDVVMGKGRFIQNLPGNVRFRGIIKSHFDQYESAASSQDKTLLAMRIVADIRENGGKFLKEDATAVGGYIEVDSLVAREKIASTFHSHRRWKKQKEGTSSTGESKPAFHGKLSTSDEGKGVEEKTKSTTSASHTTSTSQHFLPFSDQYARMEFFLGTADGLRTSPTRYSTMASQGRKSQVQTPFGFSTVMSGIAVNEVATNRPSKTPPSLLQIARERIGIQTQQIGYSLYQQARRAQSCNQQSVPSILDSNTSLVATCMNEYPSSSLSSREKYTSERLSQSTGLPATSCQAGDGKATSTVDTRKDSLEDASCAQEMLQAQLYREMGLPGY